MLVRGEGKEVSSPMALPKIEAVEVTDTYARLLVQPLERGMGTTIGNALRRMLLSALPGAAVTWVKIEGVLHEFSTMPNVKEDAIEFLLNIKGIRLRPLTERAGKLFLEAEAEGVVTAGDIKPSAEFEVVNPECYLATLNSPEAKLTVEFNVEIGKSYQPAGKSDGLPTGALPVDAIFSPVRKANFAVAPTHIGREASLEQLTLEVWTDGTITALEAVSKAASMLVDQFAQFENLSQPPVKAGAEKTRLDISPEQYNIPLEELGLQVRTFNALKRGGIHVLGELLERDRRDLLDLRQFGPKALDEVAERLKALGYWTEPELAQGQPEQQQKTEEEEGK